MPTSPGWRGVICDIALNRWVTPDSPAPIAASTPAAVASECPALSTSPASASALIAPSACVTGGGFRRATAWENAHRLAELLRLPALGYSAAAVLQGPRAALSSQMRVLAIRLDDQTGVHGDSLVTRLRSEGVQVFVISGRLAICPGSAMRIRSRTP